ncbi:hypothetical protein B0H11DRAFT_2186611 [Mycena galericulata]|nr:hypothetical protein B0H11DRAFT_2186611 [Mycena galericulata]
MRIRPQHRSRPIVRTLDPTCRVQKWICPNFGSDLGQADSEFCPNFGFDLYRDNRGSYDTEQVGKVTLQFDGMHPDWSGARYRGLIEWLNSRARGQGIVVSGCRPLVAETIWDNAARVAHWRKLENEILDAKTVVIPVINAVTAAAVGSDERGRSAAAQNVHIHPDPAGAAMVHRGVKNGASLQNLNIHSSLYWSCTEKIPEYYGTI